MAETRQFRMPAGQFAAAMLRSRFNGSRSFRVVLLLTAAVIAAIFTAGIIADIRWMILALMLVLLVMPMLLAMLYISEAMRPLVFFNSLPHTIAINEADGPVKVRILLPEKVKEEEDDESSDNESEKSETERVVVIERSSLRPYASGVSSVMIPLEGDRESGWLWIPSSAFEDAGAFTTFVRSLYQS